MTEASSINNKVKGYSMYSNIKNITSGKYLQDSAVRKIFPPCPITGDYIVFARLRTLPFC